MIKISHVTSAHKSDDTRIFEKECTSLAKQPGYEVLLVARGDSYVKNNVGITGVGEFHGGRLKRMLIFSRRVIKRALALDADIYHFHDPELLLFAKRLKRRGKKVIFDSHEDYPEQIRHKEYIPRFLREITASLYSRYQISVFKKIDAVVFPGPIKGRPGFEGNSRRRVTIGNEPRLDEFYDKYVPAEKAGFKACYVGGLTPSRGITVIVDACIKAQVKLILAGKFSSEAYQSELENREGYSGWVEYRGICSRDEVKEIYDEASVGLCVLKNIGQYATLENLATKTYEYMSMGLPVILNRQPYNEKMVNEYGFGIVADPDKENKVVEALLYIRNNPDISKQMGENGRNAVRKRFNWSIEERKLLELYREVLS